MDSIHTHSQETTNLSGTTWSVAVPPNVQGTIVFNADNTAAYSTNTDPTVQFYWWQSGASFWMQEQNTEQGWFAIMEGRLTGSQNGNGKNIAAQQASDSIYISEFTMELKQ